MPAGAMGAMLICCWKELAVRGGWGVGGGTSSELSTRMCMRRITSLYGCSQSYVFLLFFVMIGGRPLYFKKNCWGMFDQPKKKFYLFVFTRFEDGYWLKIPGDGNGSPLQYSCLENPMDRGVWQAILHRVTQSRTWLKRLNVFACWLKIESLFFF